MSIQELCSNWLKDGPMNEEVLNELMEEFDIYNAEVGEEPTDDLDLLDTWCEKRIK